MIERSTVWLAAGYAAGFIMMGVPFWMLPYNHQGFTYPGLLLGLIGLGVVTAVLAASRRASLGAVFGVMISAFPAAVGVRVAVEVAQDPTDHNLWPFEIIYAVVMSLAGVVPGLLVGAVARRL